jgi:hypothetical protein
MALSQTSDGNAIRMVLAEQWPVPTGSAAMPGKPSTGLSYEIAELWTLGLVLAERLRPRGKGSANQLFARFFRLNCISTHVNDRKKKVAVVPRGFVAGSHRLIPV